MGALSLHELVPTAGAPVLFIGTGGSSPLEPVALINRYRQLYFIGMGVSATPGYSASAGYFFARTAYAP